LTQDEAIVKALGLDQVRIQSGSQSSARHQIATWLIELRQTWNLLSDPGSTYAYLPLRYQ
jgi:hypothetical protein